MLYILILYQLAAQNSSEIPRGKIFNLDDDSNIVHGNDIIIDGNQLYLLENRKGFVAKGLFLGDDHIGRFVPVAGKGEGPGELNLPVEFFLDASSDKLIIKDERGFTTLTTNGDYVNRFRVFTFHIGFTCMGGHIYHASGNPLSDTIIDVYDYVGNKKRSFLKKFLAIETSNDSFRAQSFRDGYLYKGIMLTDNRYLFYLNKTFGIFYKLQPDGEEILRRDLSKNFKHGEFVVSKNDEYHKKGFNLKDRISIYELFNDAFITENHIYLYCRSNYFAQLGLQKNPAISIYVFDKETFDFIRTFSLENHEDQQFNAFTLTEKDGLVRAFALIDVDVGFQVVEYTLEL